MFLVNGSCVLLGAISIVVFYPGVFQLTDFMEFFEGNQFLFEVFRVKLRVIIKTKYLVVLEFLLQKLPDLLGCQFTLLKGINCILGSSLKLVLFLLDHLHTSLKEPIFFSFSDDSLLDGWESRFAN